MQTDQTIINILFVSELTADIREIKDYLAQSDALTYHVDYRPTFEDAVALLGDGAADIDVILVDLGLFVSEQSRHALRQMVELAGETPLIVFTEAGDHDSALMAIEEGAADNLVKGHSKHDALRFRDAIAFSMARADIAQQADAPQSPAQSEKALREISAALARARLENVVLSDQLRAYETAAGRQAKNPLTLKPAPADPARESRPGDGKA